MKIGISNTVGRTKRFTFQPALALAQASFTPLLEGLVKAQTAWFLPCKLWSDYLGYACRIRRASDDAELDIGFVNGLLDEAAIVTFCGVSKGFVVTAYDHSGNNKNWTQSVATKQPEIYDGTAVIKVGGFPAILSDDTASQQDNLSVLITGSATTTAFHVIYNNRDNAMLNAGSNGNYFYGTATNNSGTNHYNNVGIGTITTYVNGVSDYKSRDQFHDALLNIQAVCSITGLDLSDALWSQFNTDYISSDTWSAPTYRQGDIIFDTSVNRSDIETRLNNFLSIY